MPRGACTGYLVLKASKESFASGPMQASCNLRSDTGPAVGSAIALNSLICSAKAGSGTPSGTLQSEEVSSCPPFQAGAAPERNKTRGEKLCRSAYQRLISMPKKSTKSRSGRKTLRHKHKVIKKVKEHHRKKAKEQKKLIKSGQKPRQQKDPGIPAEWPFKAELMKELEFKRQQILAKEQAKKDAKKLARVRTCSLAELLVFRPMLCLFCWCQLTISLSAVALSTRAWSNRSVLQAQRKAGVSIDADTDMAPTTSAEALQQSAEDRAEAFALGKRDRTDEASTSAGTPFETSGHLPASTWTQRCLPSSAPCVPQPRLLWLSPSHCGHAVMRLTPAVLHGMLKPQCLQMPPARPSSRTSGMWCKRLTSSWRCWMLEIL